jgi:D-sedoheptulose 7-phosphate isomerase
MTHSTDPGSLLERSAYAAALHEATQVLSSLASLESQVALAAQWCLSAFRCGNKLLVCGNGGSAAEAQHLVGELVGRYKQTRAPLAAIALNSDSILLTCIGNDFDFEDVFARQVEGLGHAGDLLIVFTTSGNSPNILRAISAAKTLKMRTIAFLGRDGGAAFSLVDCPLMVAHFDTARSQEGHNFLMHCLMDKVEAGLQEYVASERLIAIEESVEDE